MFFRYYYPIVLKPYYLPKVNLPSIIPTRPDKNPDAKGKS
jgi:hypothetical protein